MKKIKDKKEIIRIISEKPISVDDIHIFDTRIFYPMYNRGEFKFNNETRKFYKENEK